MVPFPLSRASYFVNTSLLVSIYSYKQALGAPAGTCGMTLEAFLPLPFLGQSGMLEVCSAGDPVTLQSCSVVTFVPPFLRGPLLESPHCRVAWALSVAIPLTCLSLAFLPQTPRRHLFPGGPRQMALQFLLAFVLHCPSPSRSMRSPLLMGWNAFPR